MYRTVRSATIKSKKVGIVYRIAQLLLLFYIIYLDLYLNKGYQAIDFVSSVVTTKVKGQGFVPKNAILKKTKQEKKLEDYVDLYKLNPNLEYKMLDTADYVIPPNEYNSVFIMTNYIETEQSPGLCEEEHSSIKAKCNVDEDCTIKNIGNVINTWNGVPTGKCIKSSRKEGVKICQISAWCPIENDSERNEDRIVRNVLNYTIFIRNNIEFKKI